MKSKPNSTEKYVGRLCFGATLATDWQKHRLLFSNDCRLQIGFFRDLFLDLFPD